MRLTVVGCAGSFPGPESGASCYLVQAQDRDGRTWSVLLDLGSGSLGPLQRVCDPAAVDLVALSHLHPDHVADTAGLYVYLRYRPRRPGEPSRSGPLPVYGPPGTAGRLGAIYGLEPGESQGEQLDVRTWQPGQPVVVGPLTLTPVPVRHPVPAFGIRVQGPAEDSPDRQVVLAYTGDTDSCPGVVDLATGADLLLAEASFVEGRDDAVRGVHLTGLRAGQAATDGGARRLVLTHLPAWNDPTIVLDQAREAYAGPVEVARPGLVVAL